MASMLLQSQFMTLTKLHEQFFDGTIIDNLAFTMHYKATSPILAILGLFVSSWHYVHGSITCEVPDTAKNLPKDMFEEYCWLHSTYTFGIDRVAVAGVDVGAVVGQTGSGGSSDYGAEHKIYHDYYQWVRPFLLLQAICFCVPRLLWKMLEGGEVRRIVATMEAISASSPISSYQGIDERHHILARFLCLDHRGRRRSAYRMYGFLFLCCQLLNLVNVLVQFHVADVFLDGRFLSSSSVVDNVLAKNDSVAAPNVIFTGPLTSSAGGHFPKMTACTIDKFDHHALIWQKHTGICVLPLNAVNARVFPFLWYWFTFVAIVTTLSVLHHLLLMVAAGIRFHVVRWMDWISCTPLVDHYRSPLRRLDYGNYLVVTSVANNVLWVSTKCLVGQMEDVVRSADKSSRDLDPFNGIELS